MLMNKCLFNNIESIFHVLLSLEREKMENKYFPFESFGYNECILRTKASDGDTKALNLRSKLSDGRTKPLVNVTIAYRDYKSS